MPTAMTKTAPAAATVTPSLSVVEQAVLAGLDDVADLSDELGSTFRACRYTADASDDLTF